MRPDRRRRHGRLTAAVVGVLVVALTAGTAVAQSAGVGFDAMFGIGSATSVTPAMASSLVHSAFGLDAVDLHSGHLHGGDVSHPASLDMAVAVDLAEQDLMLVDLNRVAETARLEADRKRAAAERSAARRGIALERSSDPGVPQSWELKNFSACGNPVNAKFVARIELVDLFEILCRDAEAAGIRIALNSAYRSPERQAQLFRQAVGKYGSESAARKWVAWSDGRSCSSRHCAGSAIDLGLSRSPGAERWLHAPVGCASRTGADTSRTSCASGERTIVRAQLYGLIFPMSHEPWHLELGVVPDRVDGACAPPASFDMPQTIAAVWRCRLAEAGLSPADADRSVAEALVVAKCESGWDTNAVAMGGKWLNKPHPATGMKYSAGGLFQMIRATANSWVDGGYANVHDPVANADGAARLWLSGWKRGGRTAAWSPWACAVPVSDAVNIGHSVLPGFKGGPSQLPSWAYQY